MMSELDRAMFSSYRPTPSLALAHDGPKTRCHPGISALPTVISSVDTLAGLLQVDSD